MANSHTCYLCESIDTFAFFELPQVPTQDGIMWPDKSSAINAPKGDIKLVCCRNCGFIGNEGYEQEKVTFDRYDFSLQHSPLFTQYIESLAERLIDTYQLTSKKVLDVGCGDGHFLRTLCHKGSNKGIGIDPGYQQMNHEPNITFQSTYYTKAQNNIDADFVSCRLVLDLLGDPKSFAEIFHHNFQKYPDSILYFEVPNAYHTYGEKIIWNVVYEHRSWFMPYTLYLFFARLGFEVLSVSPCWNDEFLGIEVRNPTTPNICKINQSEVFKIVEMVNKFRKEVNNLLTSWEAQVEQLRSSGTRSVLWGAGARGVTFLNLFDLSQTVNCAIDINPKRQGMFLPGSGHEVKAPEDILELNPELIIISNPTYASEIQEQARMLGYQADFMII